MSLLSPHLHWNMDSTNVQLRDGVSVNLVPFFNMKSNGTPYVFGINN